MMNTLGLIEDPGNGFQVPKALPEAVALTSKANAILKVE
jgi:hypothetical protein